MTVFPTALSSTKTPFPDEHRLVPPGERPAAVLLAETVRLIEQEGPLEDQDIMREAFHDAAGPEERLLARGVLLGRRLQLDSELTRWKRAAWGVVMLLALLAFLSAYGAASAVVGGGRTVNVVTAFFALLGLPTLTLVIWLMAIVTRGAGLFGYLSFGNILLWLLARLPGERRPHALVMANAVHGMLERERSVPWAFGVVSHATWTLALLLVLAALGFAFSFHAYQLTWETTILDAGFFNRFVALTGMLPHWLGFPLPGATPGANHRAFAWWLMGCVLAYGLLPRVLFGIVSWAAWRRTMHRLRLDTAAPYYRKLLARFDEMEASQVVDKEQHLTVEDDSSPAIPAAGNDDGAVVGFELPPEAAWPPSPLPPRLALVERISGASTERRAVLDRLSAIRPGSLLLVCHAGSTPDRGTERFFREASRHAPRAALLLTPAADGNDVQRWRQWMAQAGLDSMTCFDDGASAASWMGGERD